MLLHTNICGMSKDLLLSLHKSRELTRYDKVKPQNSITFPGTKEYVHF